MNETSGFKNGDDNNAANVESSMTDEVAENGSESNTVKDETETSAGKKKILKTGIVL